MKMFRPRSSCSHNSSKRLCRSFSTSTHSVAANKGHVRMGPAAKQLVRIHRLEQRIGEIPSSGKKGRVLKGDVLLFIQNPNLQKPQPSKPSTPSTPPSETRYFDENHIIPHQWITSGIPIDNLQNLQTVLNSKDQSEKKGKAKLSLSVFLVKACAMSLRQVPLVNSRWVKGDITSNSSINIIATTFSPNGQAIPTLIRDADRKGLYSIVQEIQNSSVEAKESSTVEDTTVSTFGVMNIGELGVVELCEVIAANQSGVLTVGKPQRRPVSNDSGKPSPATLVKVTLACDSRIVTPQVASTFLDSLSKYLTQPQLLM